MLKWDRRQALSGGLTNHVWRVWRGSETFILKQAPPHMAANPDIPLSSERIRFEQYGLEHAPRSAEVRVPRLVDAGDDWVLMEDLGPRDSLDTALIAGQRVSLEPLLEWLEELHRREGPENAGIQETRLEVQYRPLGLERFGQTLCQPGSAFIHGDLWPRSVLVGKGWLGLIDWEFCHHGRPGQDLGHLAAHLWMLHHVHGVGPDLDLQLDEVGRTHMAAEIRVRSEGPFVEGYLYEGRSALAQQAAAYARSISSSTAGPEPT